MTQEQCPIPQNSPTYIPVKTPTASAVPVKPHRNEIWGILPDKKSALWMASISQNAATQGSI